MEQQVTIEVPNASGEEGLTYACKRGELFRNNNEIEKYYRLGYIIHNYSIVDDGKRTNGNNASTQVRVYMRK